MKQLSASACERNPLLSIKGDTHERLEVIETE